MCDVLKNMYKKQVRVEKWERKPLKRDGFRRIFMTSHMTDSSASLNIIMSKKRLLVPYILNS